MSRTRLLIAPSRWPSLSTSPCTWRSSRSTSVFSRFNASSSWRNSWFRLLMRSWNSAGLIWPVGMGLIAGSPSLDRDGVRSPVRCYYMARAAPSATPGLLRQVLIGAEGLDGQVDLVDRGVRLAQVVIRLGVFRLDLDRAAECVDRLFDASGVLIGRAQAVERLGVVGAQAHDG